MGLLDEAFERGTAKVSDGGGMPQIPRHTHTFYVAPGVAAPGIFLDANGEERGFWLTLQSLSQQQELAILNRGMPKARERSMKADASVELVRATLFLFHEELPVTLGGTDSGDQLTRAKTEWIWEALSQRGRNLVGTEYGFLTEPAIKDPEGNG